MQQHSIPVNPSMLAWARIEAGLSLAEAADWAQVMPGRKPKTVIV